LVDQCVAQVDIDRGPDQDAKTGGVNSSAAALPAASASNSDFEAELEAAFS
jgi:hypothetical protein